MERLDMEQKLQISKEQAAMTFGMFAMCEAAQMLLARQLKCSEEHINANLSNEPKMYYNKYRDGLQKALDGIAGFNQCVATMYAELGGALKHDEVRRTANEIIRMYIDARNYIGNADDAARFDAMLYNLASGRQNTISSETRNEFRMK